MGKVADAATAMAEAFYRSAPTVGKKRVSETDWINALKKFHGEAKVIRQRYALGLLSRAMVAYQFQRKLIAAGFAPDLVRKVVFSVVLSSLSAGE